MAKKTTSVAEISAISKATKTHAGSHFDAAQLWDLAFELASKLTDRENQILSKHKLSRSRLRVLLLLNEEPKRNPSYLADTLKITKASITGLAEALSKEGLVTATASKEDRRSHTLSITAKGKALLKKVLPGYFPKLSESAGSLSRQEQAQLAVILQKWAAGLAKAK